MVTHDDIAQWKVDHEARKAAFGAILNHGDWRHTHTLCRNNGWRDMDWTHRETRECVRSQIEDARDKADRLLAMAKDAEDALMKLEDEIRKNGEW